MKPNPSSPEDITQNLELVRDLLSHLTAIAEDMKQLMRTQLASGYSAAHVAAVLNVACLMTEYRVDLSKYNYGIMEIVHQLGGLPDGVERTWDGIWGIFMRHNNVMETFRGIVDSLSEELLPEGSSESNREDEFPILWDRVLNLASELTLLHPLCKSRLAELEQLLNTFCTPQSPATSLTTDGDQ